MTTVYDRDGGPGQTIDYALGGVHNLEPDRELWDRMERIAPDARLVARTNGSFSSGSCGGWWSTG